MSDSSGSTQRRPRVVTLDIETSPLEVDVWGIWDQNVGLNQIRKEWTIISFSHKWLGDKKVHFNCTGGRGADKVRDDRQLLKLLWDVLNEADIVVVQNGKAFDMKKIDARMVMYGMKPYKPVKVIDTKLIAKKRFAFTSNRLEWLAEYLTDVEKSKHKMFPGHELWTECLKDNPKAWHEMEKYNKLDVIADEKVYVRMLPWIEGHPNLAIYNESEKVQCPRGCNVDKHPMQKRGSAYTQVGEYHRYQCTGCGGWSRSRHVINTREKRKALLSN